MGWQLQVTATLTVQTVQAVESELLGEKVSTITCKELDLLIKPFIKNNYLETCIHFQWAVGILLNVTFQSPTRESPSWRDAFYKESYNSEAISSSVQLFQTIKIFNQRYGNFIMENKSSIKRQLPKNKYWVFVKLILNIDFFLQI